MQRLKDLYGASNGNQKYSPHRFSRDSPICTAQVKGEACSSGCSDPQHAKNGYLPKNMLYFMGDPEYLHINIFSDMVRWSTKWVDKYEENMKNDNGSGNSKAALARTTTRSSGSSSNNRSGNGTLWTPKQGVDDNLFPHNVLCDGHLQHSLMACGHCYKWHKSGECVCQSPYFTKLQEDLQREDPNFVPCPGPVWSRCAAGGGHGREGGCLQGDRGGVRGGH